jgi:hypothetical protein
MLLCENAAATVQPCFAAAHAASLNLLLLLVLQGLAIC